MIAMSTRSLPIRRGSMHSFKRWARIGLSRIGLNHLARWATRDIPRILMYHRFCADGDDDPQAMPVENFRRQLRYLKQHFQLVRLSELYDPSRQGRLPPRAVALTIDDGHESFQQLALPALMELEVPATIFVVADLVDGRNWIWADKFNYLVDSTHGYQTKQASDAGDLERVFQRLTRVPSPERDRQLLELASELGIEIPDQAPARYRLMSWDQLRQVEATGLVEIGSHSCTHPIFSQLDETQSWYEMKQSQTLIAEQLSVPVTSFCFPNGQPGDFLAYQLEMLQSAGYWCGIASHFGYALAAASRYALPRLNYTGGDMNLFAKYVDGVEYLQRKRHYDAAALATDF